MKPPGKGLALVIDAASPKRGGGDADPASERMEKEDSSASFDEAADSVFRAAKDGDAETFKVALKAAIMACTDADDEGEY